MKKRVISLCLSAVLIFSLMACNKEKKDYGSSDKNLMVTIDINPSIEIEISPSNVIRNVTAVNDDGKDILKDNNYSNKSMKYVAKNIVLDLVNSGYIQKEDKSTVLLTFNHLQSDKTDEVKSEIESAIKEAGYSAEIYVLYIVQEDEKIKKLAQENNISYGKAYFCTIVAESSNGSIDAEKMVTDDISQIKNTVEKHKIPVYDVVSKANKKVEVSEAKKAESTKSSKTTGAAENKSTTKPSTTKTTKPSTTRTTKPSTTKTTKPSTTKTPVEKRTPTADENEVLRLINEERAKEDVDVPALQWERSLFDYAVFKTDRILAGISSNIPEESNCAPIKYSYKNQDKSSYVAELVARCPSEEYSAAKLHEILMESQSYKNVILNSKCKSVGISIIHDYEGYSYIVEEFFV